MGIEQERAEAREMDARDARALLARNHIGRLAFDWGGRLDIRPLSYVYAGGNIFGRTSHGAKFERLEALPAPVVFEVDEVESMHRWRSVIARGTLHLLSPEIDRAEWQAAVEQLRTLVRGTLDDADPTPERSLVFRIEIDELTGRTMG